MTEGLDITLDTETEKVRADRLSAVTSEPLERTSLVGSFFHSTAERGWQGCIVAEVAPQAYLVELFSWLMGESSDQHLVRLDEMTGWSFYDDAKWMNNAYEHGVQTRWDREHNEQAVKP